MVVYTGRPLDLTEVLDLADAVVVAWHPGIEAGLRPGRRAESATSPPHGRLPMTFPLSTGHIPTSTHQRPTGRLIRADVDHREGRYVDALTYPRLPFGHGLSYTTVEYGEPPRRVRRRGAVSGAVDHAARSTVTNTGDRAVPRGRPALLPRPRRRRSPGPWSSWSTGRLVDLEPGETRDVTFAVSRRPTFAYFGRDLTERVDDGRGASCSTGPDARDPPARDPHVRLTPARTPPRRERP